jgi:hypothetical protein
MRTDCPRSRPGRTARRCPSSQAGRRFGLADVAHRTPWAGRCGAPLRPVSPVARHISLGHRSGSHCREHWVRPSLRRVVTDTGLLAVPPSSPESVRLYADDLTSRGCVNNLTRAWAHLPAAHDGLLDLLRQAVEAGGLTPRQRGIPVGATASTLGDAYCSLARGTEVAGEAGRDLAGCVLRRRRPARPGRARAGPVGAGGGPRSQRHGAGGRRGAAGGRSQTTGRSSRSRSSWRCGSRSPRSTMPSAGGRTGNSPPPRRHECGDAVRYGRPVASGS